jgi:hypothetical protein
MVKLWMDGNGIIAGQRFGECCWGGKLMVRDQTSTFRTCYNFGWFVWMDGWYRGPAIRRASLFHINTHNPKEKK